MWALTDCIKLAPGLLASGLSIHMSADQPRSSLLRAYEARGIYVVNDGGIAARLTSQRPAVVNAYREITSAGAMAGLTLYFVDRWLRDVHYIRVSIWARLLAIASVKGTPEPTLGDLAASIRGLSEEAVRKHFVRWWLSDQSGDPEWEFFRAAVQIVERSGRSYQFQNVVLDDILHADDLAVLDAKVSRVPDLGQGALILPTPLPLGGIRPVNPSGIPTPLENPNPSEIAAPPKFQTGSRIDPPKSQTGSLVPPLEPPSVPVHEAMARPAVATDDQGYPSAEAVPGLLAEKGVSGMGIRRIMRHPQGAYWAARWLVWVTAKTGLDSPGGFLHSRIMGACNGNADDQEPPLAWITAEQRRQAAAAKRDQRFAGLPDAGTIVKKRAQVRPETSVLPELESLWEHVRRNAPAMSRASLDASTAVLLDGATLVIELPSTTADLIRKHRGKLLELARAIRPELADVRFQSAGGQR